MSVIILGGSISGILSASALYQAAQTIDIVEQDDVELNSATIGSKLKQGTPQEVHIHGLLESGRKCMERLFPGFTERLIKNGARKMDRTMDIDWFRNDWKVKYKSNAFIYVTTRHVYEKTLRQMLMEKMNDKVTFHVARFQRYIFSDNKVFINGVLLDDGKQLKADLVIDAMGRASPTDKLLSSHGYEPPAILTENMDLVYTSNIFEIPEYLQYEGAMFSFSSVANKRGGGMLRANPECVFRGELGKKYVQCSIYGFHDNKPDCKTNLEFLEFSTKLPTDAIHQVIKHGTPIFDAPKSFPIPKQLWKRYDLTKEYNFPKGLLIVGDSVATLNPSFGQGMATAAREACLLCDNAQKILNGNISTFEIQKQIGALIWLPFNMNAVDDSKYPQTTGYKPYFAQAGLWFLEKAFNAADDDSTVFSTLLQIVQLEASPFKILRPDILMRIFMSRS